MSDRKKLSSPLYFVGLHVLAFSLICLASCTKRPSEPVESRKEQGQAKIVNLATWSNYISPELAAQFEKKTGIKVQISNYSSNEELLAKLQAGASGYDVIMPSDYMVFTMSKLGLLQELDQKQIPNLKAVDPKYQKKIYDPANRYSVPYDWGTTGIAVNHSIFKGQIKSWKDLFQKEELNGKFSLLDDSRETIGAALKSLGYSLNSKNPAELARAKETLLKAKIRVKAFNSETKVPLATGEVVVAHAYMTDALQARQVSGKQIEYLIPEEGGTFWIDNLTISKGASHLAEAHQLINFLLEPQSSLSTVLNILVAPTNMNTFKLLPQELQQNPGLFPPQARLAKCEMIEDLGEATQLWDQIWTEIKAQN